MWLTVLIVTCMIYCGIHYVYNRDIKDDNVVEEAIEDVVKKETGVDIDLTPDSVEK